MAFIVVMAPIVLGVTVGTETGSIWTGLLVWFGSSWVLGMIHQKMRDRPTMGSQHGWAGGSSGQARPAARDSVVDWCAKQYQSRVTSYEAQSVFQTARSAGWPPIRQLLKFHETNWPTVVSEARVRFGDAATAGLLTDDDAQEAAIKLGFSWDLGIAPHIDEAVNRMRSTPRDFVVPDNWRNTQTSSTDVDAKRWAWVSGRLANNENRLVTTPTYVVGGPRRFGGHVFLTDRQLLIAATEPPFGSESRPFVISVAIGAITFLGISDDGMLVIFNPDSRGNEASNVLDLYPSPFSQTLVENLRELWVQFTGGEPEGDWSCWSGPTAPRVSRSKTAWISGT